MAFLIAALAAAAAAAQEPDVPEEVRTVLQGKFGKYASPEKLQVCATRVSAAIAAARPPQWGRAVLQHLPEAAEYFRMSAFRYSLLEAVAADLPPEFPRAEMPQLPANLLQEGVHLQLEYLAVQVERVARTPWTEERRKQTLEQIDRLAAALKDALVEKLPGRDGETFAAKFVMDLHRAWTGSLDLPFNRFMDQPVSAAEFSKVVDGIRAAVRPYAEVTLTREDLGNKERLNALKVQSLASDAQEAAFKICATCFSEFRAVEDKVSAWSAKAEKALGVKPQAPDEK